MDGEWVDQPGALIHTDADDDDEDNASVIAPKAAVRGRGKAAGTTRKTAAATKKAPAARGGRGKKVVEEEEDEEEEADDDVIMLDDDDDEEDEEQLFVKPKPTRAAPKKPLAKAPTRAKSPVKKTTARTAKQSTLDFSQASTQRSKAPVRAARGKKMQELVSREPSVS